jgi:hypothetical protein
MLQSIHIANCRLMEHILKRTAVLETAGHLRDEFVGNVYSKTAAVDPAVKNMAKVLFAFAASWAVLPNAPGTAKTQRSQSSWPEAGDLFLKPIINVCRKFFFGWHTVYVTHTTYTVKHYLHKGFYCNNLCVSRQKLD